VDLPVEEETLLVEEETLSVEEEALPVEEEDRRQPLQTVVED
jgi:hypothetical protein